MKTSLRTSIMRNTLATALVVLCSAAQAGEYPVETTTTRAQHSAHKTVNYADLDLSSNAGREVLAGRIGEAARDVCGPTDYRLTGSLQVASRNRSCIAEAVNDALSRVSNATSVAVRN